jgi:RNA polymerase sigma-70 factor (ECF subfamily)
VSFTPDSSRDSLAELARRVRGGDVAAFEGLFRALHAPLCEVVDCYVRSQAVAEEIVQDLLFVVWMQRERLPADASVRAYLFAAARNRALHHLRHAAVVRHWARRVDSRPDVAGIAASGPLPDVALEARERAAALRRAIDQLPPRARLALVLQREHEMTQAEVAVAMGISVKGVEKLLATAKQRLRERLGAHAGDESTPSP